jgi:hypothetical protein
MAQHLGHWTETIRNPKQMPKIAEKQNLKEHCFSFFGLTKKQNLYVLVVACGYHPAQLT